MRVSYCDGYYVPLPDGHPFPMVKFPALHRLLLEEELLQPAEVMAPRPADWADLLRVHTSGYLRALAEGALGRRSKTARRPTSPAARTTLSSARGGSERSKWFSRYVSVVFIRAKTCSGLQNPTGLPSAKR